MSLPSLSLSTHCVVPRGSSPHTWSICGDPRGFSPPSSGVVRHTRLQLFNTKNSTQDGEHFQDREDLVEESTLGHNLGVACVTSFLVPRLESVENVCGRTLRHACGRACVCGERDDSPSSGSSGLRSLLLGATMRSRTSLAWSRVLGKKRGTT